MKQTIKCRKNDFSMLHSSLKCRTPKPKCRTPKPKCDVESQGSKIRIFSGLWPCELYAIEVVSGCWSQKGGKFKDPAAFPLQVLLNPTAISVVRGRPDRVVHEPGKSLLLPGLLQDSCGFQARHRRPPRQCQTGGGDRRGHRSRGSGELYPPPLVPNILRQVYPYLAIQNLQVSREGC
jgi:hypothetical protein